MTNEEAMRLLTEAGVFYGRWDDEDEESNRRNERTLNLNDAMYWGCSDSEYLEDDDIRRVAELFLTYGWAGILYWVAVEKRGGEVPEFVDVRRMIEFVKNEEAICKEEPSSSKRAYLKRQYTIGECE